MDLQKIRKELPHGSIGKIAKTVSLSCGLVSDFFRGNSNTSKSTEILHEAAKIIRENRERKAKIMKELNDLFQ